MLTRSTLIRLEHLKIDSFRGAEAFAHLLVQFVKYNVQKASNNLAENKLSIGINYRQFYIDEQLNYASKTFNSIADTELRTLNQILEGEITYSIESYLVHRLYDDRQVLNFNIQLINATTVLISSELIPDPS